MYIFMAYEMYYIYLISVKNQWNVLDLWKTANIFFSNWIRLIGNTGYLI